MANRNSDSNFPSSMNFQDMLEMSNTVAEDCAATLPTTNAQGTLAETERNSCIPQRNINYEETLENKIGTLFDSTELSDVTFIVGEEKREMKAHKMILALSSPVFTAMFYGEMAKTRPLQPSLSGNNMNNPVTVIEVPDCSHLSFQSLLQFIYKGDEPKLTVDHALSLLYTSRKYGMRGLEDKCCVVLSSSITADNVFDILYAATFYNLTALDCQCWEYMEDNPVEVLNSHLENLTHETMQSMLRNDKLNANEVELFQVLIKWAEFLCHKKEMEATPKNIRTLCEDELKLIRFPVMTGQEFADVVVPSQILTVDQVAKIFTIINSSEEKRGAMSDLLNSEFTDKKRVPRPVTTKTLDKSAPPVFTFIAQQIRDREQSVNPGSTTENRVLVAADVGNPENIIALLGLDATTAVTVQAPLPLIANNVPSLISQAGDRARSRQRQSRRTRRRNASSNNNDAGSQPRQSP